MFELVEETRDANGVVGVANVSATGEALTKLGVQIQDWLTKFEVKKRENTPFATWMRDDMIAEFKAIEKQVIDEFRSSLLGAIMVGRAASKETLATGLEEWCQRILSKVLATLAWLSTRAPIDWDESALVPAARTTLASIRTQIANVAARTAQIACHGTSLNHRSSLGSASVAGSAGSHVPSASGSSNSLPAQPVHVPAAASFGTNNVVNNGSVVQLAYKASLPKLPTFSGDERATRGDDALAFLEKLERLLPVNPAERWSLLGVCLEGMALTWHLGVSATLAHLPWEEQISAFIEFATGSTPADQVQSLRAMGTRDGEDWRSYYFRLDRRRRVLPACSQMTDRDFNRILMHGISRQHQRMFDSLHDGSDEISTTALFSKMTKWENAMVAQNRPVMWTKADRAASAAARATTASGGGGKRNAMGVYQVEASGAPATANTPQTVSAEVALSGGFQQMVNNIQQLTAAATAAINNSGGGRGGGGRGGMQGGGMGGGRRGGGRGGGGGSQPPQQRQPYVSENGCAYCKREDVARHRIADCEVLQNTRCYNCNGYGHTALFCTAAPPVQHVNQVTAGQVEEEEKADF